MIGGHGGDIIGAAAVLGCPAAEIIDMSSNMNPLGPLPDLVAFLGENLDRIAVLPEPDARRAVEAFARFHDLAPETVTAGNGTTQFIYALPRALAIERALILGPTYADYADACRLNGAKILHLFAPEDRDFAPDLNAVQAALSTCDTAFFCNPNNPTGRLVNRSALIALTREHPGVRFVIDESYLPFATQDPPQSLLEGCPENVLILCSLSKIFRIPGLRIGFAVARGPLLNRLKALQQPWSVNGLAAAAVEYLMDRRALVTDFVDRSRAFVAEEKSRFTAAVNRHSAVKALPSETVFILLRLPDGTTAADLRMLLLEHRILVRDCTNFEGLGSAYFRISLKTAALNRRLAEHLIRLFPK